MSRVEPYGGASSFGHVGELRDGFYVCRCGHTCNQGWGGQCCLCYWGLVKPEAPCPDCTLRSNV